MNNKQKQADNTMKIQIKFTGELPRTVSSNPDIRREFIAGSRKEVKALAPFQKRGAR